MLRAQSCLMLACAFSLSASSFSGQSAFNFTKQAVDFGPRPSGSEAIHKLQSLIVAELKKDGCELAEDAFVAKTPKGEIAMKNILCKFPGKSGKAIVISGHYDTKLYPGRKFVGANDGGSSTGFLLEMARALKGQPRVDDVYVVFLDGEEATGEWSDIDSVYGSKHLARRWQREGFAQKIKALINVDMIGDRSLNIKQEPLSNTRLTRLIWGIAADLGYQAYFVDDSLEIEDDHLPFIKAGIPAVDLIDFDYPPWHEDSDTLDKLSAESLEIVGNVVMETIHKIEKP